MRDLIKLIGFLFKVILITLVIIFCFAGLYGIVYASDPHYKNGRHSLTNDAFDWGLKMTKIFSLALLLLITPVLIFQEPSLALLDEHAEVFALCVIGSFATMAIGFIGALFTLFND